MPDLAHLEPSPALHAPSPGLLSEGFKDWYAVYTCARHEKRIKQQMDLRQIPCALPLYRAVHRWKDRRKELALPLFPSYIFVHAETKDRLRVLEIPGVVNFVSSQGRPLALSQHEIGPFLRDAAGNPRIEPHPFLQVGRQVRLRSGPMAGLEGTLLRKKEGLRLVISIEILMRSVAVEVDEDDVEPCELRSRIMGSNNLWFRATN